MHVIRHDFELDYLGTALTRDIMDENLQSFSHTWHHDPKPILRTPDHVLFAGIYDVVIRLVVPVMIIRHRSA